MKTYDFTKWFLEHTIKFPKSQRFVMAKRIEEALLGFYDLLILAAKEEGNKKAILNKAGFELERLKHYLRLCKDLNILNIRQYEYSSKEIVEIRRLLGGWQPRGRKVDGLDLQGFSEPVPLRHLPLTRCAELPTACGVYVVIRPVPSVPKFLAQSPAGWFKGLDPSYPPEVVRSNWVDGASVVYIGKAGGAWPSPAHWPARRLWFRQVGGS